MKQQFIYCSRGGDGIRWMNGGDSAEDDSNEVVKDYNEAEEDA